MRKSFTHNELAAGCNALLLFFRIFKVGKILVYSLLKNGQRIYIMLGLTETVNKR